MKSQRILFALSLLALILAVYSLVTGADYLVYPLMNNPFVPIGTLLTWLGFVALPATVWFSTSSLYVPRTLHGKVFSAVFKVLILAGLGWGVAGFYLADNWSYNFSSLSEGFRGSPEAAVYFRAVSYGLAGSTVVALVFYLLISLVQRRVRG